MKKLTNSVHIFLNTLITFQQPCEHAQPIRLAIIYTLNIHNHLTCRINYRWMICTIVSKGWAGHCHVEVDEGHDRFDEKLMLMLILFKTDASTGRPCKWYHIFQSGLNQILRAVGKGSVSIHAFPVLTSTTVEIWRRGLASVLR